MRDRRDYEYVDYPLSAEEPQFFETFQDKRAPKGFMGMRGKKANYVFYGVRGKKDLHNLISSNEVDNNDEKIEMLNIAPILAKKEKSKRYSKFYNIPEWRDVEDVAKRVPSGFMGMRGRRGISGFYGVRGKRDVPKFNNVDQIQKKSALTKYIGIRGKKLVSFNVP